MLIFSLHIQFPFIIPDRRSISILQHIMKSWYKCLPSISKVFLLLNCTQHMNWGEQISSNTLFLRRLFPPLFPQSKHRSLCKVLTFTYLNTKVVWKFLLGLLYNSNVPTPFINNPVFFKTEVAYLAQPNTCGKYHQMELFSKPPATVLTSSLFIETHLCWKF